MKRLGLTISMVLVLNLVLFLVAVACAAPPTPTPTPNPTPTATASPTPSPTPWPTPTPTSIPIPLSATLPPLTIGAPLPPGSELEVYITVNVLDIRVIVVGPGETPVNPVLVDVHRGETASFSFILQNTSPDDIDFTFYALLPADLSAWIESGVYDYTLLGNSSATYEWHVSAAIGAALGPQDITIMVGAPPAP